MQLGWQGPFRFYSCYKSCPECHAKLVTQTDLDWNSFRGLYHSLGIACHCVSCNIRYRAFGSIPFKGLFIAVSFLVLMVTGSMVILAVFVFSSWLIRLLIFLVLFLCLWKLPGFLFSTTERIWWEKARLEKIFKYEHD